MTWVLPWLIALGLAGPATADPGAAAVAFLEDVRHGRLTAERIDQTALSRFAGKDKRAELGRRLTALAATFNPQLPLAVEATKVDGDLAGVLVCQNSPLDPAGPRLFTVAMVLRDGVWMPAPAPGSFENTLYGYDPATARRAAGLEHWMMHERATRGTALRDRAAASLRAQLADHIPPGELRVDDPAAIVHRFLAACAARDLNAALTLLGGLEDPPPDDWAFRHRAAFAGLGPDARDPLAARWRLLAHPQVARAILATEDDPAGRNRAIVWLGCLDPAATRLSAPASDPTARPVRIPLRLVRAPDRAWRIDLPPLMVEPPQPRQPDDPFAPSLDWYTRLAEACEPRLLAGFPRAFRPRPRHPADPLPRAAQPRRLPRPAAPVRPGRQRPHRTGRLRTDRRTLARTPPRGPPRRRRVPRRPVRGNDRRRRHPPVPRPPPRTATRPNDPLGPQSGRLVARPLAGRPAGVARGRRGR